MLNVQDYQRLVYQIAYKYTVKTGQSVEDLAQEAMLHLCLKAHTYDPAKAKETTFVAALVERKFIDMIRAQNRKKRTLLKQAQGSVQFITVEPEATEYSEDAGVALAMVQKVQEARRRKKAMVQALKREGWTERRIEKTFTEIKETIGQRRKVQAYIVSTDA